MCERQKKHYPDEIAMTMESAESIPTEERCPYRGLQTFEAEHADFFFGREALTRELDAAP